MQREREGDGRGSTASHTSPPTFSTPPTYATPEHCRKTQERSDLVLKAILREDILVFKMVRIILGVSPL